MLAPIALFAYKRPDHTLRALEALSACELAGESCLYIYCDGVKRPEDTDAVNMVRQIAGSRQWCGSVEVIVSYENRGIAASVISGVGMLCNEFGSVIVLEDDLIVSKHFLRYMNDALELYRDEERVMQISGFMFNTQVHSETDAIFLPLTTSWGWGTWRRAWSRFDPSVTDITELKRNRKRRHAFNLFGNADYYTMLERSVSGRLDSWAIKWYLFVFMNEGLVLHPVQTFVANAGFDGSGTHCGELTDNKVTYSSYNCFVYPDKIEESDLSRMIFKSVAGVESANIFTKVLCKSIELYKYAFNFSRS